MLFKRKKEFLIVFLLFITHIDSLSQYSKKTVIKRVQLTEYVFCDSRIESIIDSLVFWPKSSEPTNRYYRLGNTFDRWPYLVMDMRLVYRSGYPTQKDTNLFFTFRNKLRYYYNARTKGYTNDSKGFFLLRGRPVIIDDFLDIPGFLTATERKREFVDTVRIKEYRSFEEYSNDFVYGSALFDATDGEDGASFRLLYKNASFSLEGWSTMDDWEIEMRPWEWKRIPRLPNIHGRRQREFAVPMKSIDDTALKRSVKGMKE